VNLLETVRWLLFGRLSFWMMVRRQGIFPMQQSSPQSKIVLQLFAALSVVGWYPRAFDRRRKLDMQNLADDEAMLLDAHGSMRAGNPDRSWRVITQWLNSRGDEAQDYAWVAARIANWDDAGCVSRLYQERVARLLMLKRTDEVLDVAVRRLASDAHFRPKSAADTLKLAQLAAQGGRLPRLSEVLLEDFAARFKGDPRVAVAEALKRHLIAVAHAQARRKSA
jgi:hypothetical protein